MIDMMIDFNEMDRSEMKNVDDRFSEMSLGFNGLV